MLRRPRPSVGLLFERWYPLALAIAAVVAVWNLSYFHMLSSPWREKLVEKVVSACAILAAYLVTVVAILPAVEDKKIIVRFKEWGYFAALVGYIRAAVWSTGLLLITSLSIDLYPAWVASSARLNRDISCVWWGLLVYVLSSVLRATNLMLKVLLAR